MKDNELIILSDHQNWAALFVNGTLVAQDHEIRPFLIGAFCPVTRLDTRFMPKITREAILKYRAFPRNCTLASALDGSCFTQG